METNKDFPSIGILDIYGFETFITNGFEQYFINYTNEKLQKLYLTYVFDEEKNIFIKEGLDKYLAAIIVPDNSMVIKLLDEIFDVINEKCTVGGNPTDKQLLESLEGKFDKKNEKFEKIKVNKINEFKIIHSVKDVTYSANFFLDKNADDVLEITQ